MNRFDIISKINTLTHEPRWPLTGWQPLNTHGWASFQTLATQAKNSYNK